MTLTELLPKVKENLILAHDEDDALLLRLIAAAANYAESYQHLPAGFYFESGTEGETAEAPHFPPTTEQAVIMLVSNWYESRDSSTGGFFADSVQASVQVWNTVNTLLRLDRLWGV